MFVYFILLFISWTRQTLQSPQQLSRNYNFVISHVHWNYCISSWKHWALTEVQDVICYWLYSFKRNTGTHSICWNCLWLGTCNVETVVLISSSRLKMKILFREIFTSSTEISSYEEPSVWCGFCCSVSFFLFLNINLKQVLKENLSCLATSYHKHRLSHLISLATNP